MARRGQATQLGLPFPCGWGGARRNAGRKAGPRPKTLHRARPMHRAWQPVHVTLRACLAPLRSQFVYPSVRLALVRATRRAPAQFRIVHYSVQRDHVHLVVEAADKRSLSSGVRSVMIRIARYVNDLLARRGRFWADRWHGRALASPREVRAALVYVLANFRKHARHGLRVGIDPYSSGPWFDGWREWRLDSGVPPPLAESVSWPSEESAETSACSMRSGFAPQTWLVRVGWKRCGLVGMDDAPMR